MDPIIFKVYDALKSARELEARFSSVDAARLAAYTQDSDRFVDTDPPKHTYTVDVYANGLRFRDGRWEHKQQMFVSQYTPTVRIVVSKETDTAPPSLLLELEPELSRTLTRQTFRPRHAQNWVLDVSTLAGGGVEVEIEFTTTDNVQQVVDEACGYLYADHNLRTWLHATYGTAFPAQRPVDVDAATLADVFSSAYVATPKHNGTRQLVVAWHDAFYAVTATGTIAAIPGTTYSSKTAVLILDTELLADQTRVLLDILHAPPELTYTDRHAILETIVAAIPDSRVVETIPSRESAMAFLAAMCERQYDGLVFYPASGSSGALKYKPPHLLTLDVAVVLRDGGVYDILVNAPTSRGLVPFRSGMAVSNTIDPALCDGTLVVEIKLHQDDAALFTFVRARRDRRYPNSLHVAEQIAERTTTPLSFCQTPESKSAQ